MRDLVDPEDGENRAVRMFLALYGGCRGIPVNVMARHLRAAGFPHWPSWVNETDGRHLTKSGAQAWLRHLFSLEHDGDQHN